jgi:ketosteroid isomerase-like protein
MSQENVEIVRAGFEAWNRGDMDAFAEVHHPDVVLLAVEGWPEPGPYVGRDTLMRQFEQMRSTWDADNLEAISDFIDVGDRVVMRISWDAVGQGPGFNIEVTQVFTVRKGKIIRIEIFWDHAQALEAVGLSE